jgi:phospholipase C
MDTRRDFIRKAATLSGGAGLFNALPVSIQKALAIDPAPGSTYLDAEHIVILMQENRSFDHCYGALQGVRGFNDRRTVAMPDRNLTWLQKNDEGKTYLPFRLNIKETNATWLGSLPHSWSNQVDARNNGKYDKWLLAKASGHEGFERVPLTLGYYNREDIPFYYSLADAFTVCDQNFCSSLTGTTPNRLYLWSGTIRAKQDSSAQANVSNGDVNYEKEVSWKTFPDRLEENGISWRIYQNEISLESGLEGDEDSWLSNFTDNPIEWFSQYHVRFSKSYRNYLERIEPLLPGEIEAVKKKLEELPPTGEDTENLKRELKNKEALLKKVNDRHRWSDENFEKLSQQAKNLHTKAFTTNTGDPHYRQLTSLHYKDGNTEREMKIPQGDVLYQFRQDVNSGTLPAVSWIIGSENFSDHPGAPWYGAWYVSEVMDILTKNPAVWKKTIFILCYDENDGYFDHVPPFVPPHPGKKNTGLVSKGIDTAVEYVTLEQDLLRTKPEDARESPIGLGYRVPLVIASPWSRGGAVCSQVFDHTSIIRFMEKFLTNKTGKQIEETNISAWRRTVCGDLTSIFKAYNGEQITTPASLIKERFYESIHKAQFKKDPTGYVQLTADQVDQINKKPHSLPVMPRQEKGTRLSCPLPYELYTDGKLSIDKKTFDILFAAANEVFGKQSAGSPFNVYAHVKEDVVIRNYAVTAGDQLKDSWELNEFKNNNYHLEVNGPNGFFRKFAGNVSDPALDIVCGYQRKKPGYKDLSGNVELNIVNQSMDQSYTVEINDAVYKNSRIERLLGNKGSGTEQALVIIECSKSSGWYDFSIKVKDAGQFEKRYAGRVETGQFSRTDPAMGNG